MAINESLAQLSNNCMYSAIAVYAGGMVAFAAEWAFGARVVSRAADSSVSRTRSVLGSTGIGATAVVVPPRIQSWSKTQFTADKPGRIAVALTLLAFGLHLAAVLCRGLSAQRVPWGNMYEFSTAAALAVSGAFLVLLTRQPVRWLGVFVVPVVLLTLGLAVTVLYTESAQLVPALNSYWLVIHVLAAVISSGAFTLGAVASLLYLLVARYRKYPPEGGSNTRRFAALLGRLPSAEVLDRTAYRAHVFVFPLWTFAVIAGAIWAERAWGRYWGWDPKEIWAFITWVVYAAYLHARATAGWKGTPAAMIALVGFGCFLFNYFGVNLWITGLHSYAGV